MDDYRGKSKYFIMDDYQEKSRHFTMSVINWRMGLTDDSQGFVNAFLWFLKDPERWKRHYVERYRDWVEHDTLEDFITSRIPEGLQTTPLWVYGQMLGLAPVHESAKEAKKLLVEQLSTDIKAEYKKSEGKSYTDAGAIGEHGINRYSRVDNINSKTQGGTSAEYTIRRLMRDGHDELVQRIIEGELSANAAAIQAGFRRKTISISDKSPETAAKKIITKFGDEFAKQLCDEIILNLTIDSK
jgi:hypothetical protein